MPDKGETGADRKRSRQIRPLVASPGGWRASARNGLVSPRNWRMARRETGELGVGTPWTNTTTSSSVRARPAAALASRLERKSGATRCCWSKPARASHPYSRMPLSFGLLIDNPAANWRYESEPEPGTANRADPGAARQAAGRLERDQRPGLGARPAARLRHLGADGLPRLELAGRGAAVHPHRELRRRRRQQRPRHRRPAARSRPCPTRTRSTTRCSRPPWRPASSSTPTTTARTRKASSRRRPASSAAGA